MKKVILILFLFSSLFLKSQVTSINCAKWMGIHNGQIENVQQNANYTFIIDERPGFNVIQCISTSGAITKYPIVSKSSKQNTEGKLYTEYIVSDNNIGAGLKVASITVYDDGIFMYYTTGNTYIYFFDVVVSKE